MYPERKIMYQSCKFSPHLPALLSEMESKNEYLMRNPHANSEEKNVKLAKENSLFFWTILVFYYIFARKYSFNSAIATVSCSIESRILTVTFQES